MQQEINVGDIVHVRMTVVGASDRELQVEQNSGRLLVKNEHVVRVEPRPLCVGDRVTDPDGRCEPGRIVHIIADINKAWVTYPTSHQRNVDCVEQLSRLERIA